MQHVAYKETGLRLIETTTDMKAPDVALMTGTNTAGGRESDKLAPEVHGLQSA